MSDISTLSRLPTSADIPCSNAGRIGCGRGIPDTMVTASQLICFYYNVFLASTHFLITFSFLLLRSMVPDVVDAAYLETGVRREELFYAFFVFGNKFGAGVTLGVSTGIYKCVSIVRTHAYHPS